MKHLKLYSNYINEKMGVPDGISKNADAIFDFVYKEIQSRIPKKSKNFKFSMEIHTVGPGYPVGLINLTVNITEKHNRYPYIGGSMLPKSLTLDDGGYGIDMNVVIEGEFFQIYDITVEGTSNEKFKTDLRRTIYHELGHIHEAYSRKSTGALDMDKLDTFIYDMIGKHIRNTHKLPRTIEQFFFLVYLAQAAEVSARIPEAYSMVKDIKDPHKRLDIIKNSSMWNDSEQMIEFDPQDYIDNAKHDIGVEEWPRFKKFLGSVMGDFMSKLDDKSKNYMLLYNSEQKALGDIVIPNKRNRTAIVNASTDIEKMMHEWKGIINRAGEKLKEKLSKITMAE